MIPLHTRIQGKQSQTEVPSTSKDIKLLQIILTELEMLSTM